MTTRMELKKKILYRSHKPYEKAVFGIVRDNRQVGNRYKSKIGNIAENDPTAHDVYDKKAESKAIGRDDSARNGDQEVQLLAINESKYVGILQEKGDETCLQRKRLRRRKNIPAVIHQQSVAQNMLVMNREYSNTNNICSKLLR